MHLACLLALCIFHCQPWHLLCGCSIPKLFDKTTLYVAFCCRMRHPAVQLSSVLGVAAAGSSREIVGLILSAGIGWCALTLRGALSDASSVEMFQLISAANPQPWQQATLAAAFAGAAFKGNMVAAKHLLLSLENYQFQDVQLVPALNRAATPAPRSLWPPLEAAPMQGCDSPAFVELLLGVHRFSKAILASCMLRCENVATVQLLVAAASEPWTSAELLPAVVAACNGRKKAVLEMLLTGVEGVQYTAEQLAASLREVASWWAMLVPVLLRGASGWTKPVLIDAIGVSGSKECVEQLLAAAPEPWTSEELLPAFNATVVRGGWRPGVVMTLLQVEGVRYPTPDLKRALEIASRDKWPADAVDALLKALPRCSQAMLESMINSAPNSRDNAVDKLLGRKKWTQEQLWQLVCNAVSAKKHAVVRKVLVAGKGLPWDRNLLFRGLYDACTGKGGTVVLVSPFAEALTAGAAAAVGRGGGSSKQKQVKQKQSKQQEPSSSSDAYCKAVAAAHPPSGGPWAAKHFKAALQLASKGRRPNTIMHLLQLPGIVWDWRCIKDAWLVAFEKDAKEVMARLLDAPGVWTPARVKEWAKEAAKQGNANAKALLEGKRQAGIAVQQQQGKRQCKGK